jgi:hypothetical protein
MELDRKKPSHILLFILLLGVICLSGAFILMHFINFIFIHFGENWAFLSLLLLLCVLGWFQKEAKLEDIIYRERKIIEESLKEDPEKTFEEGVSNG